MSLSIAGLKVFVGAANRPPASHRRGFLWPLPRAAATRWRYRHGFRSDILWRVDRNRGAKTKSPFLLEASLKVKWDCAHSHPLARIAPANPELTQSFKGPASLYTLSAFARLGCVRTRIRWRGGRARRDTINPKWPVALVTVQRNGGRTIGAVEFKETWTYGHRGAPRSEQLRRIRQDAMREISKALRSEGDVPRRSEASDARKN
jgi:hypothetical protein